MNGSEKPGTKSSMHGRGRQSVWQEWAPLSSQHLKSMSLSLRVMALRRKSIFAHSITGHRFAKSTRTPDCSSAKAMNSHRRILRTQIDEAFGSLPVAHGQTNA